MGQITFVLMLVLPVVLYFLWVGYGVWKETRPDHMRAVFVDSARQITVRVVKISPDGKSFKIDGSRKGKYHVVESAIFRTGKFRVPTSYYRIGQADPVDILTLSSQSTFTDDAFHEATEAHVARDIINMFSDPLFTITTSMMVIMAVVAVANGFVYVQLNSKLDQIVVLLGG